MIYSSQCIHLWRSQGWKYDQSFAFSEYNSL